MSNSSRPHGLQPIRLLRPWNFPGKSTGVGCNRLLHSFNKIYTRYFLQKQSTEILKMPAGLWLRIFRPAESEFSKYQTSQGNIPTKSEIIRNRAQYTLISEYFLCCSFSCERICIIFLLCTKYCYHLEYM